MKTILQWIGGGVLSGLGIFLTVFIVKIKNKNNQKSGEIFQEIENPDKFKILNAEQKVLKWEEYQEQLRKRRK